MQGVCVVLCCDAHFSFCVVVMCCVVMLCVVFNAVINVVFSVIVDGITLNFSHLCFIKFHEI